MIPDPARMGPCLYCLTTEGVPSAEHVFPRGLGPHANVVLPKDAVCEDCNNWLGRQVDAPFLQQLGIQLTRGLWQVRSRKGKALREIPLHDANSALTFGPDGELQLHLSVETGATFTRPKPGGTMRQTVSPAVGSLAAQRRRTRRALLKVGLGVLLVSDKGPDPLHADFDLTRAVVLGAGAEGLLLERALDDPAAPPDLFGTVRFDVPGSRAAIEFGYGPVRALTSLDVRQRPDMAVLANWASQEGWSLHELAGVAEPAEASEPLQRLFAVDRARRRFRPTDTG